ncbi:hypothetical protein AYI70_g5508, partial [Smittium culicis]
MNRPIVVDR